MVDEFGRVIPYDSLDGTFTKGTTNEDKKRILERDDSYRNDGSYVAGSKVKDYLDDTMGFYGETKKNGEGRKLYVGDIHAHYSKETGIGEICTRIITDRNDIKEQPRFISARINKEQYNAYMAADDGQRLKLASDYLEEIRLESTRNRTAEVKNIRMEDNFRGGIRITANIDGEDIHRDVTQFQADKMVALESSKREKMFAKVFECKGVKHAPGADVTLDRQILIAENDLQGSRFSKKITSLDGGDLSKASNPDKENTAGLNSPSMKAGNAVAANFEIASKEAQATENGVSNGMKR